MNLAVGIIGIALIWLGYQKDKTSKPEAKGILGKRILILTLIIGALNFIKPIINHFAPKPPPAATKQDVEEIVANVLEKKLAEVEPKLKREFPAGFILFAADGSTTIHRPRIKKVLFDADWDHVVVNANLQRTKATIIIPDLALVSGGIHLQGAQITENISLKPGTSVQSGIYRSSGPSMWYKVFPSDHVTALFAIGFKE